MGKDFEIQKEAELDPFSQNAKSSVKLKNTTRGVTWEVKVVTGEEKLISGLMDAALSVHNKLNTELNSKGGNK